MTTVKDTLATIESHVADTVTQIQSRATPLSSFVAGLSLGGLVGALTAWIIWRRAVRRHRLLGLQDRLSAAAGGGHVAASVSSSAAGVEQSPPLNRRLVLEDPRIDSSSAAAAAAAAVDGNPNPYLISGAPAGSQVPLSVGQLNALAAMAAGANSGADVTTQSEMPAILRSKSNESLFKHDLTVCQKKLLEALGPLTTLANIEHEINMMFNQRKISRVFEIRELLSVVSEDGDTLLTQAVKVRNAKLALKLLSLGSDPNHTETGESILVAACEMLAQDLVIALLSTPGLELQSPENQIVLTRLLSIHFGDQTERKAIETLALRLIAAGADLTHRTEVVFGQRTEELVPLELAVEKGFPNIVSAILARHPAALEATFKKDQRSETLLHRAVRENDMDSVKILLKADPWVMNLMVAAVDAEGRTVLHVAAENRVPLVLPVLLEDKRIKALVNQQDARRETALHWIARNGNVEMFKILMIQGADPNIANSDNESAFGIAIAKNMNIPM